MAGQSPTKDGLLASTAFAAFVGVGLFVFGAPVMAQLPTGGVVVGGNATITQNSSTQITINQTTDRGVINWQSFGTGQGGRVDFVQPGASSVTLNRVRGPDPSVIAGQLNVNRPMVVNTLTGMTGATTVREGGLVGLVGPGAGRNGAINARVKRVTVGGTQTVTVDLAGDGLLALQIRKPVPVPPAIAHAAAVNPPTASLTISAAEARGVVDSVANVQGMAKAAGVRIEGGTVVFGGTR